MQIDKLFDSFCSLIQEQKKIFNEMNHREYGFVSQAAL